jgi:hypothetical protein
MTHSAFRGGGDSIYKTPICFSDDEQSFFIRMDLETKCGYPRESDPYAKNLAGAKVRVIASGEIKKFR